MVDKTDNNQLGRPDQKDALSFYTDLSNEKTNSAYIFIIKKSEKLSAVLYRLTDKFEPSDPLRKSLRIVPLESLSFIITGGLAEDPKEVLGGWLKILSLLSVAQSCGMITSGNYELLKSEYEALASLLRNIMENQTKDYEEILSEPTPSTNRADIKDTFIKDINVFYKSDLEKDLETKKYLGLTMLKNDNEKTYKKRIEGKRLKSGRDKIILDIIKNKKEVSIKDISSVLKDFSEKTIQREILDLVEKGLLGKRGERRWSRYYII